MNSKNSHARLKRTDCLPKHEWLKVYHNHNLFGVFLTTLSFWGTVQIYDDLEKPLYSGYDDLYGCYDEHVEKMSMNLKFIC